MHPKSMAPRTVGSRLDPEPASPEFDTSARLGGQPLLRALDVTLVGLALLPVALPLALAVAMGTVQRQVLQGRGGTRFERLALVLPGSRTGCALQALGAVHWPVLLNILRGQMAFVGPRPRPSGENVATPTLAVRPGLVNPWFIRRRTAVDFGTEAQADAEYLASRGLRHDLGLLMRGALASLLPPPAASVPGRVRVCDVAFDNLSMSEAIARLRDMLDGAQAQQVSFVNPACVNIAATDRGYRRVLARAALVLPDGIGIKIGSDLLGTPLKQNANGTDLFPRLCEMLQARGASVFLLGGQAGVADSVAAEMSRRWPGIAVVGTRHGYFSAAEEGAVAEQVRASRADVLLVARGVPAQDLFIDRYLPLLGVNVALGVGGLFDFMSGRIPRAPMWMRETGFEWVYRLVQEPGRMWRRYLVGNLSFLARVGLQRLGLRQPAADTVPQARAERTRDGQGVRAVIFATRRAANGLPVPADTPAALLPMGCHTVIEQVMERLLHAAITEVDIVASDRPEALRALLGDGSRWGVRLHWHLAADPHRPYGVLRSPVLQHVHRLVIGHADNCPGVDALMRLSHTQAWALHAAPDCDPQWSGWASLAPDRLAELPPDMGIDELVRAMAGRALPPVLWTEKDLALLNGSHEQLHAALATGQAQSLSDVPASWLKTSWGAMSPLARVHPQARLTGPVRIGPGCIVGRDAELGPAVVLSRNVVVSGGSRLSHCVILPDSYVGAGLDLSHAVVNGARVRHVRLGVETSLAPADALLLDLKAEAGPGHTGVPRLLAGIAWLLAAPTLAIRLAMRRWFGRGPDWRVLPVVTGRDEASGELLMSPLRCAYKSADGASANLWAVMAGLRDVAAGRRSWFGARPRGRSQWYALRPEWQGILSRTPVGLLHAPAWTEGPAQREEACAAADIFLAVQPQHRRAVTVLGGLLSRRRKLLR
jgi:N-acetylglucosaminyldiphosphoundecaprenol N-acetyl-beta-D-mannosaminyltransferase